jgi:hypothetical protein
MIIGYTGIGAKKNGIHTEQEFLNIMNKEFTHKDWNKNCKKGCKEGIIQDLIQLTPFKDWVLPDDFAFFTLNDWIEYSGAGTYNTLEELKKDIE